MPKKESYSAANLASLEQRALNDADLIKGGAKYVKDENAQRPRLEVTREQARDAEERGDLLPEEFRLKDIPVLNQLPPEKTLKRDYQVDTISTFYEKDCPVSTFALTDDKLKNIVGIDDADKRKAMLEVMAKSKEAKESIARIFHIGDIIRQKKKEDPNHSNDLTTEEVLEAIDAAGYRPANLLELLACSKNNWQPAQHQLTNEQQIQGVYQSSINALGSPFTTSGGLRSFIPRLHWDNDDGYSPEYVRELCANDCNPKRDWHSGEVFLVIRKKA